MAHNITDYERGILFEIAGDCPDCFPIIHNLCLLPFKRKGEFFRYCLAKGITGSCFKGYYESCGQSPARFYGHIIGKIDGLMKRPLIKKDLN